MAMGSPGTAHAVALMLGLLACGPAREEPVRVVLQDASDPRYALSATLEDQGARPWLVVRVVPEAPWHLAADAPAGLVLSTARGGAAVGPAPEAVQREISESRLVLRAPAPERPTAPTMLYGRLHFGLCEAPREHCTIVRRELELRLPDASAQ